MRVVLDTNILVRAHARASGPARELLEIIERSAHVLILSPFILAETRRVLGYSRIQASAKLTRDDIEEYIRFLVANCELVLAPVGRPIVRGDPDDDAVVQTAVAGRADILCTLDRHFQQPEVQRFCSDHGVQIRDDVELLKMVRRSAE